MTDLSGWTPRPRPTRQTLEGRYVRLEPLSMTHVDSLYTTCTAPGAAALFDWLFEYPPADRTSLADWVARVSATDDPLFFAVIDPATGNVLGRQALMRIDPAHGVIEIGNILWGAGLSRTPAATEALYLTAAHVFDDLGYRRFEWKCHNRNAPSKAAALRFGFQAEGVFRSHMVHKGQNRDTAWFAMTDADWHSLKPRYTAWLDPANFDAHGQQRQRLQDL